MTIVHTNRFDALKVSTAGHLYGGGIVGVESNSPSVTSAVIINNVTNNTFSSLDVTTSSGEIRGGGVIGVQSPGGAAGLANVSDNEFRDSVVRSASSLSGGGIVGASSEAAGSFAVLDEVTGNTFARLEVGAGGAIKGGGVIGADGGTSSLNKIEENRFDSLAVASASSLSGGGIVGVWADNGNAALESLVGNTFSGAGFRVGATDIAGGGIVGLRSNEGASTRSNLPDNTFQGLEVGGNSLSGGGIVGVSSGEQGYIVSVRDNLFDQLAFSSQGLLKGGGILGAQADNDSIPVSNDPMGNFAVIRDIWGNTFTNVETTAGAIEGGGILGVWNRGGANGLQRIDNNHFWRLSVQSKSYLSGGGIVGVWADEGYAVLDTLSNSTFYGYKMGSDGFRADDVSAAEYIEGGGIAGVRSNNAGYIGPIDNTWFAGLKVTAGTYIDGGGIVGATGPVNNTGDLSIGIHNIVDSVFVNNMITAQDGPIMGGLVYSYGLAGGLAITDSWFMDNLFISDVPSSYTEARVYGTVTVDTGVGTQYDPYTLTLKATSDGSTVFLGNVICDSESQYCEGEEAPRTNSHYVGTIPSLTGLSSSHSLSAVSDPAEANAKLIIDTEPGGAVGLYDPVMVNQDNGKTFDMTVQGGGDFEWAGANVFTVGAPGTININSGTTTLASGALVDMGIAPFSLVAPQHSFNLATGARMNVLGGNTMTLDSANLNGTLFFNLYHTNVDQPESALLTLHTPQGAASIEGSVVQLSSFKAGERLLEGGDRFYLIATDGAGYLSGDPINNRAYARQGLLIGYNFIIDKQPNPASGSSEGENQYLVARLEEQRAEVGDPVYVEFKAQTGDPLHVEIKDQVDDPLYVAIKEEVDDPLHVEFEARTGDPLHVEFKEQVGDPLHVEVKDQVGDPLHVEFNAQTGEPLVVFIKDATGEPLYVEVKDQVGEPLYVEYKEATGEPLYVQVKDATGEPLYVEVKEATGEPLYVQVKDATGEPLYVEYKEATDEPLYVQVKDAKGEPLYVEYKEATGEPLYVEFKDATGEPLYVEVKEETGEPPHVEVTPYDPSQDTPDPVEPSQDVPADPIPVPSPRKPVGPADETTVLVGGRAASLAFLAQRGGWLPDHSYQAADLALDQNRGERAWVPFGGVDAGRWHLDTGSRIRLSSANMLLGLATRHRGDSGAALLGIFLEAGKADYDTRNHFTSLPSIDGDGDLDAVGGGLLARHTWDNDLRIEASLRTGRLKNDFRTKNYEDENGEPARYKSTDHYLAAHLGVGRGWQISEKNDLDLLLRYYWTRLEGGKAALSNGEWLRFDDAESHRVRVGGRLTHTWRETRFWYVGAAVEREFDSKVNASANMRAGNQTLRFNLDEHDFKGTTSIGEIGVIIRSRKNSPFSLEAGLQGYAGKVKGVSGGIRIGYEF
jgi:Fe2+ transport system protein FeoA